MRKTFKTIVAILLIICALTYTFTYTFSTFHDIIKEQKYEKKSLLLSNYTDYIAINASMVDYQTHEKTVYILGDPVVSYSYSCTIKIETRKSQDVKFSNAKIRLKSGYTLELDSEGNSTLSYLYTSDEAFSKLKIKTILNSESAVATNTDSISGYVLVLEQENKDVTEDKEKKIYTFSSSTK